MVRDQKYRNTPVTQTLDMWSSVAVVNLDGFIHIKKQLTLFIIQNYELLLNNSYHHFKCSPRDDKHFIVAIV